VEILEGSHLKDKVGQPTGRERLSKKAYDATAMVLPLEALQEALSPEILAASGAEGNVDPDDGTVGCHVVTRVA
jgi:hypothetical protein